MKKLPVRENTTHTYDCPYITHKTGTGVKYHPKVGSAFCKKCEYYKELTEDAQGTLYVMCKADETRKLE